MAPGYTQSGTLFRAKTRALEKLMQKSLAPFKISPTLIYPTAPNRLSPRDIPGYEEPSAAVAGDDEHGAETDAWAWWRKDEGTGEYRLLRAGFEALARAIREDAGGHVDGVVGFSQGGAMAALLAAALETEPQPRTPPPPGSSADYDWSWVQGLREANGGQPLKFAVVYSGFFAPPEALGWFYEPKIRTPTLHFIGSLDTVVEESRSRNLVVRCEDPMEVVHPGGHYVPVSREWAMPLIAFVKKRCEEEVEASKPMI